MPEKPAQGGHRPWFDWLRLFLALEVVWLHIPVAHRGEPWLVLPIAPVPAFVAISGYLITASLKSKRNLPEFWRNRALRILPGFFCALLVTWVCFGNRALADSVKSYFMMQPIITGPGSNFALWSLSAEEVLYGLLALALIFNWIDRPIFARILFWIFCCVLAVFSVTAMATPKMGPSFTHPHGGWPTGLSIPMFFFAGVFMHESEYLPFVQRYAWAFLAVSVGGSLAFMHIDNPQLRGLLFLAMSIGAAFGVVGLGSGSFPAPKLKFDLSYGTYIFHLPILGLIDRFSGLTDTPYLVACFVLPLLAACISWFAIERPCLNLKNRLGTPKPAQA